MRRRFLFAAGIGAVAATVLFVLVLQSGRSGVLDRDLLGDFYDAQARSLLDGRIDVDPDVPGFEGFRMDDATHIYQPIVPSLARIPLFVATDRFDGRLTGLSMVGAFVVAMGFSVALAWRLRCSIRGDAPVGRLEMVATGFAVFGIGASSLLFLGGKSWVYHEGLLWATALCLGSFNHLVRWLLGTGAVSRARLGHLAGAVLLAGLAINTRSTIGFGPVAALGLTAAVLALTLLAGRSQPDALLARVAGGARRLSGWHPQRSTGAAPLALVVIVVGMVAAVVLYAAVNTARFDSWFGVPLDRQVLVADDLERQAALAANDNSLFGPQYVPSVLLQILRPNALGVRAEFPYLAFPNERPTVVGDAVFSELDWSSSVPVGEPLLFLAGLVGIAALVAPRRLLAAPGVRRVGGATTGGAAPEVAAVRIAAVGAAIGGGVFIAFGYIAQRYLTDLFPMLVLCALVGLHTLGANIAARSPSERLPGPDRPRRGGRTPTSGRVRARSGWRRGDWPQRSP